MDVKSFIVVIVSLTTAFGSSRTNDGEDCNVPGKCVSNGSFDQIRVTKIEECLNLCKASNVFNWSTYNPEFQLCFLYEYCPEIDTTQCANCITNAKGLSINDVTHFLNFFTPPSPLSPILPNRLME